MNELELALALYPQFADGEKQPSFITACMTVEELMKQSDISMEDAWKVTRQAMNELFNQGESNGHNGQNRGVF